MFQKIKNFFRKKRITEGIYWDYFFEASEEDIRNNACLIKIKQGKYKDVIFAVGAVNDLGGKLSFQLTIYDPSIHTEEKLLSDKKFSKIVLEILSSILSSIIGSELESIKYYEENGENYTEEPSQKRTVYKKSSSVFGD